VPGLSPSLAFPGLKMRGMGDTIHLWMVQIWATCRKKASRQLRGRTKMDTGLRFWTLLRRTGKEHGRYAVLILQVERMFLGNWNASPLIS